MSKEYYFRLGRERVSTNLVQGISPTNTGYGVVYLGSGMTQGKWYETHFTQIDNNPLAERGIGICYADTAIGASLPNGQFGSRWFPLRAGEFKYNQIAQVDSDLNIISLFSIDYTLHGLYELDWRSPLDSDPFNWDKSKMSIERGQDNFAQVTHFITDLVFVDDGFDYLLAQYEQYGRETKVPIRIERRDKNGIYRMLTEGEIYLDSVEFNLSRGEAKVNIESTDSAVLLDKGKDLQVSPLMWWYAGTTIAGVYSALPVWRTEVTMHDQAGAHVTNDWWQFSVYDHFKGIIAALSEGRVGFYSEFLETLNQRSTLGGDWLTMGKRLTVPSTSDEYYTKHTTTFSELYENYRGQFNLDIGYEVRNGVPTVRIEPKGYWQGLTPKTVTLDRVNEIKAIYPRDIGFRELQTGYKHLRDPQAIAVATDDGLNIEDALKYSTGNVNSDNFIDRRSEFIIDSGWLWELVYAYQGARPKSDMDDQWFTVLTEQTSATSANSQITGGAAEYNGGFDKETLFDTYYKDTLLNDNAQADNRVSGIGLLNYKRILLFSYPITLKQFQDLQLPEGRVSVSGAGLPAAVTGVPIKVDRANESGLTEFEVLAE